MSWQKSPEALVNTFHRALPDDARVERRKMFGYPCAFVGGHMVCGLHQESLIVRLPEAERAQLLAVDGAHVFEPMAGRPMKEYVVVPPRVLDEPEVLRGWLNRSVAHGASLPAKVAKARTPKAPRGKK